MIAGVVAWPILIGPAAAAQTSSKARPRNVSALVENLIRRNAKNVEIVTFADRRLPPVKIVRGRSVPPGKPETTEIVTFANPRRRPVHVVRGRSQASTVKPGGARYATGRNIELVTFADPREQPVTVLRGSVFDAPDIGLFGPASTIDLDRVAFAVDGAESSHGADPRMWRPEPDGPQGPMQVSAAAATDSGGGDRFDLTQNRVLGRAYLARLYRRYGNWPDAIAAYNWGPGNFDSWVDGGRPPDGLPFEVERYRDRVLHDVGVAQAPISPPPDQLYRSAALPARENRKQAAAAKLSRAAALSCAIRGCGALPGFRTGGLRRGRGGIRA